MRILLFGSRGFLGSRFAGHFPDAACPEADIADAGAVARVLDEHRPELVINAAGRTGTPNVDWCEDHRNETITANVTGALVVARACAQRGIRLVHLGTGCIFSGDNGGAGFAEDDAPNFTGSLYSRSKAAADALIMELVASGELSALILRFRMPFEASDHPRNLLAKIPRFTKVVDAPNSITYIPDLLDAAARLIALRASGIYHVVNPGSVRLTELAALYRDTVDPQHAFTGLSEAEARALTRVPRSNCVLNGEKLAREGIALPATLARVAECFARMAKASDVLKA